ncbi:MAG: adenylyl-sulfate kinase [Rhodospirillales bacterium]|jgi:adenylyl-sulfate kinase|nr:adenylyl-sulfate kinase [Rhodospirillales bacterium]MDP6884578.1 adenylyl-sulfate kinase [Rhodospirillales bacterium]
MIIWLAGLSGSGKTTIGRALYERLKGRHTNLVFLDGDEFRQVMGHDLGYSYEDRQTNARRFSHLCAFLDRQGIHMICAVLSNYPEWLRWNRETFDQYFEIFVDVSLETLLARDVKNIYKPALAGEKKDVVGVDIPFVPPGNADFTIDNNQALEDITQLVDRIIKALPRFT